MTSKNFPIKLKRTTEYTFLYLKTGHPIQSEHLIDIISYDIYEETEHIETVKAEIESSFHYSIRVHEIVGQLLRKCTPKLCKRHSMFGGTKSTQTIPTLIAHESFVHCDKTSEVKSWPEHKGTCTIVLKVKALFLIFTSKLPRRCHRRTKEDRKCSVPQQPWPFATTRW